MTSGASRQLSSDWAAAGAASRSDRGGQAKVRRSGRVTSLVTASGGIARAAYVRALSAGLAVGGLLKNAGLTRAQIRKPEVRIPVRSQVKFLNELAEHLNDDFLGLHLAQSMDLRELGLTYYVLASSEDLPNALMRLARYSAIHNECVKIHFSSRQGMSISLEYVGVLRTSDRHQMEFFVAILVRLCRQLTGRNLSPLCVRLAHRRSEMPPELRALFGCPVEFGAPMDQVIFPLDAKDAALPNADPYLNKLLQQYCENILSMRRIKSGDWRSKIENVIAPLLPHGEATIENVARRLGVSHRTLARRLSEEGVNFVNVRQELRMRLAKQYFREPGMSIAQIGWLLGYREQGAFSHAFRRWTGSSPRTARSRGE